MSAVELVNLTPHPVVIYPVDAPDIIRLGAGTPIRVIEREPEAARLVEAGYSAATPAGSGPGQVPVYDVTYCPQHVSGLPAPRDGVGYIVSLPVALACLHRRDLLVPYREVRNRRGTVIGCRALSRPTTATFTDATAPGDTP